MTEDDRFMGGREFQSFGKRWKRYYMQQTRFWSSGSTSYEIHRVLQMTKGEIIQDIKRRAAAIELGDEKDDFNKL